MEILVRYGTHYEAIKKIGSYPLTKTLHLSDLGKKGEMKAISQKCYTEMKKDGHYVDRVYELSVIDYLCLLSTRYLIHLIESDSKIPLKEITPEIYCSKIVKCIFTHKEETKNLLRLFFKDPSYLSIYIISNEILESNPENRIASTCDFEMQSFNILGTLWFTIARTEFFRERFKNTGGDWFYGSSVVKKFSEQYWEYAFKKGPLSKYVNNNK